MRSPRVPSVQCYRYSEYQSFRRLRPSSCLDPDLFQAALLAKVPSGIIELGKRLVKLEDTNSGITITVENRADGRLETAEVDLLVGADGIRSVSKKQTSRGLRKN